MKDNDIAGFGQITALFLSSTPVWSLWQAFLEYRAASRQRENEEESHLERHSSGQDLGSIDDVRVTTTSIEPRVPNLQRMRDRDMYEMHAMRDSSESASLLRDPGFSDGDETSHQSMENSSADT